MKKIVFFITLLILPAFASAIEPSMDLYQEILKEYVKPERHHETSLSWVDYSGLKNEPGFNKLVQQLAKFSPAQLEGQNEKLAFYINAYNILAMKIVVDNWPVESIKDIGSFFKPVWKKKAGIIGGEEITLHTIEHEILRPMGEPRIHMAIVCASISCPDLRLEPYTAVNLNEQLDDQARNFLSNPKKGLIIEKNQARTSRIFDWFDEDFEKIYGDVNGFISRYLDLPDNTKLKANLPYDWSVNGE